MTVIAAPARLQTHLAINLPPKSLNIGHAFNCHKLRYRRPQGRQMLPHDQFILRIHQGCGLWLHIHAFGDQGSEMFSGNMLMVEGHDVGTDDRAPQIIKVGVVAKENIGGHLRGGSIPRTGEKP